MNVVENVVKKLDMLIGEADQILSLAQPESFLTPGGIGRYGRVLPAERVHTGETVIANPNDLTRFSTSAAAILHQYTGGDSSVFYSEFKKLWEKAKTQSKVYGKDLQSLKGILESARREISEGFLLSYEIRVASEVYGDLLDQVFHLLNKGYDIAAVAVAGAVLEDGERRIAKNKNVQLPSGATLIPISQELARAGVLSSLEQKQIVAWGDIRDKADHGNFQQFQSISKKKKEEMLEGIRDFLAKHLS